MRFNLILALDYTMDNLVVELSNVAIIYNI